MSEREEVLLEPGFVLHHRPFRNSSLIVDCLTAGHGRVGLISQGARRPGTGHRALLQPFARLRLSWVRRGELGRLTHVEAAATAPALAGDGLLAGFYLNELLIRLVARGDYNPAIFDHYCGSIDCLATDSRVARTVRLFELALLEALGYRVGLDHDAHSGAALTASEVYVFEHESGLTVAAPGRTAGAFPGRDLISLREGRLDDRDSLRTARRLLETVLQAHLGERPLKSRQVLDELVRGRKRAVPHDERTR